MKYHKRRERERALFGRFLYTILIKKERKKGGVYRKFIQYYEEEFSISQSYLFRHIAGRKNSLV